MSYIWSWLDEFGTKNEVVNPPQGNSRYIYANAPRHEWEAAAWLGTKVKGRATTFANWDDMYFSPKPQCEIYRSNRPCTGHGCEYVYIR